MYFMQVSGLLKFIKFFSFLEENMFTSLESHVVEYAFEERNNLS